MTELVTDTLRGHFGCERPIAPQSLVCANLGICDDEVSELVEQLFIRLALPIPEGTTVLPYNELDLTVEDLARFVIKWMSNNPT